MKCWATVLLLAAARPVVGAFCASYSAADESKLCSDVVTYPFLVSDTLASTDSLAVARAGAGDALNETRGFLLLSQSCRASVKRLVCAQTHPRGCDLSNETRVCRSYCEEFHAACDDSSVPLGALGLAHLAADDCSSDTVYRDGEGAEECEGGVLLAAASATVEPYAGETCADVVFNVTLPPTTTSLVAFLWGLEENGTGVNGSVVLAPMQPPFVVQSKLELGVASVVAAVPLWASLECQRAARQFFCAATFLTPASSSLLSNEVSVPRPVSREQCASYVSECAGMLARGSSYLDSRLFVECGAHPAQADGLVVVVDLLLPSYGLDALSATPFLAYSNASARLDVSTTCPHATSDRIDSSRRGLVESIDGTACAWQCPIKMRPKADRAGIVYGAVFTLSWMIFCCTFTAIAFACLPEKRKNQPLLTTIFVSNVPNLVVMLIPYVTAVARDETDMNFHLCHDQTSPVVQADWSPCTFQSIYLSTVQYFQCILMSCVSIDIFVRVVLVANDPNWYVYHIYFPVTLVLVLGLVVLPGLALGVNGPTYIFGYEQNYLNEAVCYNLWSRSFIYATYNLWIFVSIVAMFFALRSLKRAVDGVRSMRVVAPSPSSSGSKGEKKVAGVSGGIKWDDWKLLQAPAIYIFMAIIGGLMRSYYLPEPENARQGNVEKLEKWVDCIFEHHHLSEDDQQRECGEAATGIYPNTEQYYSSYFFSCAGWIFVLYLFPLSKSSVKAWKKYRPWTAKFLPNYDKKSRDLADCITSTVVRSSLSTSTYSSESEA